MKAEGLQVLQDNTAVTMHDAFGLARRARREQYPQRMVGIDGLTRQLEATSGRVRPAHGIGKIADVKSEPRDDDRGPDGWHLGLQAG